MVAANTTLKHITMRYILFLILFARCTPEYDVVEPEPKVYDTIAPTDKPIDSTDRNY